MSAEIVDEIKNAVKEIERLHLKTQALSASDSGVILRQISQQISFFPAFLSQLIKLVADLEHQFGEEFYGKCVDEVQEIAETGKSVEVSIENLLKKYEADSSDTQIECAESLMKGISRLNILQQRITGKMMKSRKAPQ